MSVRNNLLVSGNGVTGFRAFDGSDRYFKQLKINDTDCCFLEYPPLGLHRGRKDNPAISNPDDGYFILEKEFDCCCPTGRCVVVESVRWYGAVLPVGTIFPCPPTNRSFFLPIGYVPPPNPMPNEYVFDPTKVVLADLIASPLNTPTFGVTIINPDCCNADGSKNAAELIDEIFNVAPRKSGLVVKNNALVVL